MTVIEEWRDIPEVIGRYEVSNLGRIRSLLHATPLVLKPTPRKRGGYMQVKLKGWPGAENRHVHHVVAAVFLGPRPSRAEVRHQDGDSANNAASNLSYGTAAQNAEDRRRHGTQHRGERTGGSRLTESDVVSIRRDLAAGVISKSGIAIKHGVSPQTITDIRMRRTWAWLSDSASIEQEAAA